MKDLKTTLTQYSETLRQKEDELRSENIFEGAGYVEVITHNKDLAKVLDYKKSVLGAGYIIKSFSTNGALQTLENDLKTICEEFEESVKGIVDDKLFLYTRLD